jgi:hypothetical protein
MLFNRELYLEGAAVICSDCSVFDAFQTCCDIVEIFDEGCTDQ